MLSSTIWVMFVFIYYYLLKKTSFLPYVHSKIPHKERKPLKSHYLSRKRPPRNKPQQIEKRKAFLNTTSTACCMYVSQYPSSYWTLLEDAVPFSHFESLFLVVYIVSLHRFFSSSCYLFPNSLDLPPLLCCFTPSSACIF